MNLFCSFNNLLLEICLFFFACLVVGSIVSKVLFRPQNMQQLCNFIIPQSARSNGSIVDFKKYLSKVKVNVIGIFGTRDEIKEQLRALDAISSKMLSSQFMV